MHIAFTRLFHSFQNSNPASKPQIGIIIEHKGSSGDPLEQAIADFLIIAFYFLLRVGEYTCPTSKKRTRTVQFRCNDVTLWRELPNGQTYRLAQNSLLATLLAATSVNIHLSNQKNGVRDSTVTHKSVLG
jgi:hypothetical protein